MPAGNVMKNVGGIGNLSCRVEKKKGTANIKTITVLRKLQVWFVLGNYMCVDCIGLKLILSLCTFGKNGLICLKKIRRKSHYNGYFNKDILLIAEGGLIISAHSVTMLKAGEEVLGMSI